MVVGLPPAFGKAMTKTIINIPHSEVLKEVMAGIEEEGLKARLVRVNKTADVGFIGHEAAKLSGSGVGIGIICRGTSVIHQKDLAPLQNLELFPQSPLVERETFRAMGRNAAKYAKGERPNTGAGTQRSNGTPEVSGLGCLAPQQRNTIRKTRHAKHGTCPAALSRSRRHTHGYNRNQHFSGNDC